MQSISPLQGLLAPTETIVPVNWSNPFSLVVDCAGTKLVKSESIRVISVRAGMDGAKHRS